MYCLYSIASTHSNAGKAYKEAVKDLKNAIETENEDSVSLANSRALALETYSIVPKL